MMQMPQKISALARRSLASLLLALAASAAVGAAVQGKGAGEPQLFGLWSNPAGSVTIRINGCGTEVCGTVAKANAEATKDARDSGYPNLEGLTLLHGTIVPGSQVWRGTVLVPDLGRSFDAHIELTDPAHAKITGCVWHGLLCRSQIWRRM